MGVYSNFAHAIDTAILRLKDAPVVRTKYWQGVETIHHPEMASRELFNYSLTVLTTDITKEELALYVKPDLPWADDHFNERVSRIPMNPPPSEEWWPYSPKGNNKFKSEGKFSHTYPERYWPKNVGLAPYFSEESIRRGIRFPYGDLDDLISMLEKDPFTRQAYLPVWFPEDLGAPMNERKPCTLGYHFIVRNDQLHIIYYIRSCDFYRHFRNDIYMTVLLQHWVLKELRHRDPQWDLIHSGSFTMHITSLHLFHNDYHLVFLEAK